MLAASRLTFDSIPLLMAGAALASLVVIAFAFRRVSNRSWEFRLIALGLMVLAYAAAGPRWVRGDAGKVAVMVDHSESTRGATYRDDDVLRRRVVELVGKQPYTLIRLGEGADKTTLPPPPPDAAAVLLFSDGRFEPLLAAPPVHTVIDPALEQPVDAAVTALDRRGEQLVVTTSNTGAENVELSVDGTKTPVPQGTHTFTVPAGDAPTTTAQLLRADQWPENNALTIAHPPPALGERWWVGEGAPGSKWRSLSPADLPVDASAWLAPSVVVLNNVPASALSTAQGQRLQQYVRDLGGGLLILGGDQAFASGGYHGSSIGAISPLASTPPTPAAHWVFLLDASGSMAGATMGRTRLDAAVAATRGAIAQLPPNDVLSVGGFSDELRWWTRGKPVKEFALGDVPTARGPTNLDAALRSLVASLDRGMSSQIVLLTDGQVELSAIDPIAAALKDANAPLHVLAIGRGPGLPALRKLTETTGGTFAEEVDAAAWAAGLMKLLRQVSPRHWTTQPVDVRFVDLPAVSAAAWNRTWLRHGADELARTSGNDSVPMAARMNVGSGNVAAVAFRPPDPHVEALAARIQSPPRDPRLNVTWRTGRRLVVDLDAVDGAAPINGLSPTLVLTTPAGATETFPLPQTGPGRYVLDLPAPRPSVLATLRDP